MEKGSESRGVSTKDEEGNAKRKGVSERIEENGIENGDEEEGGKEEEYSVEWDGGEGRRRKEGSGSGKS